MPQRPLDCSECRKPIAVEYTEIVGEKITRTVMCLDCPHLERRMYGVGGRSQTGDREAQGEAGLACGNCGTSLEAFRTGHLLGCAECYRVFSELLANELKKQHKISHHLNLKQGQPLHIGRAPGEITEISPTLQLIALNEALDETLIREDYEQAALLRDQIQALKQKAIYEKRQK